MKVIALESMAWLDISVVAEAMLLHPHFMQQDDKAMLLHLITTSTVIHQND